jgi:hypothetical protein
VLRRRCRITSWQCWAAIGYTVSWTGLWCWVLAIVKGSNICPKTIFIPPPLYKLIFFPYLQHRARRFDSVIPKSRRLMLINGGKIYNSYEILQKALFYFFLTTSSRSKIWTTVTLKRTNGGKNISEQISAKNKKVQKFLLTFFSWVKFLPLFYSTSPQYHGEVL